MANRQRGGVSRVMVSASQQTPVGSDEPIACKEGVARGIPGQFTGPPRGLLLWYRSKPLTWPSNSKPHPRGCTASCAMEVGH